MALVFDLETVGQGVEMLPSRASDYIFRRLEAARPARHDRGEAAEGDDAEAQARRRQDAIDRFALDPTTGQIICIGLRDTDTGESTALVVDDTSTERDVLIRFWESVRSPPDRWVSFNGKRFDVPYLKLRSAIVGVTPSCFIDESRGATRPHFDVYEVLAGQDTRRRGNLDYFSAIFGIDSPKAIMDGSKVHDAYHQGRIKEIAEYCLSDCRATAELYERLRAYYE